MGEKDLCDIQAPSQHNPHEFLEPMGLYNRMQHYGGALSYFPITQVLLLHEAMPIGIVLYAKCMRGMHGLYNAV